MSPVYNSPNLGTIGPIPDPVGLAEVFPPLINEFFHQNILKFGRVHRIRFRSYGSPIKIR